MVGVGVHLRALRHAGTRIGTCLGRADPRQSVLRIFYRYFTAREGSVPRGVLRGGDACPSLPRLGLSRVLK